ncbi:MAG TPA: hypothetical protein ENG95_01685 [Nitrospirae bacterium]|nr:hypothetical protein BMS3Abin10_01536 [bacterium BMS3Abin10]GBE37593.1 hypothetical protein BMS3Bbin08_00183 [bacterium BMS3Bbin08]HDH51656.1 hypothetical protein [Nitrospirota bacterium]HDK17046.1 hypothetical protein [Nitrospirota bacterium]HDK82378.1 hypothetical protein [Nitrospirota bacterium]
MGNGEVKRSKKKKTLIIILAVLAVIVIAGAGSTYYVGTNDFCGLKCHQMKTRYSVWSKSTHNQIKCITCHSEPGFVGELKAHIDGLNYLKSFLKKSTAKITIFATRRNPARLKSCIHCHPADTLKKDTKDIRINHVSHVIDNEILCTDCHANMIHISHDFEMSRPQEKTCIACHLKAGARTNCQSCHIKPASRRLRHLFILETLKESEDD